MQSKNRQDVVILTYEGIYSLPMVEAVLNNPNANVVKIINSVSVYGNKCGLEGIFYVLGRSSLLFLIPKFCEKLIQRLYTWFLPIHARPFRTLEELKKIYKVDIENVTDVNAYPHERHKDAILLACYLNQVVAGNVIENYKYAFNTHPSPLPEGRGMFIQFWLIKEDAFPEKYFQSIQWMEKKVDSGAVVIQKSVDSTPEKPSMADYMNKVTVLAIDILREFDFKAHPETVHITGKSSYYTFPKAKDVIDFWMKGCRFIRLRDILNYLKIKGQS